MTPNQSHSLIEAIANWVRSRSDLSALGVAGSWARGTARPDSDLDLLILAAAPDQFQSNTRWITSLNLEDHSFRIVSHKGAAYGVVWSCHLALDQAAELELTFAALDWASIEPVDAGTRKVVSDGFKVVVDKDGRLSRLLQAIDQ